MTASHLDIKVLEPSQNVTGTDFCRLCLEGGQPSALISLRLNIGEVPVPKMFVFLTGLEIDFDDDYPKVACSGCFTRLEQAYQTRKDFLDSYTTLLSMSVEPCHEEKDVFEDVVEEDGTMTVEILKEEILSEGSDVDYVSEEEKKEPVKRKRVVAKTKKKRSKTSESDDEKGTKKKVRVRLTKEEHKAKRKFSSMDPNKCYICQEVFESPRELNIHLPQHTDMLPYTCELCVNGNGPQKDKIITLVLLHRHVRMHSGNIPCPQCPYRLFGINRLYNHVKHCHKDAGKQFICETCGSTLPNRNALHGHMMRHRALEEGRYTCEHCGAKFGNRSRLERHMLSHKETKEFQCLYCDKSFSSQTLLLTHERDHVGKAMFICETCEAQFTSRVKRNQHITDEHPDVAKANRENEKLHFGKFNPGAVARRKTANTALTLQCNFDGCDYVAHSYGNLHYHKEKHRQRFLCKSCPKRFPTLQSLQSHQVVHTGERAFACDQCEKTYTQSHCLRRHQLTHMTDAPKPYVCNECGESFTTKPRLDNHVLKHMEPQHRCEICLRMFRYKGDWTRHMRHHEEGKLAGHVAKIE